MSAKLLQSQLQSKQLHNRWLLLEDVQALVDFTSCSRKLLQDLFPERVDVDLNLNLAMFN